jgi:formylglycine-generating enzyme required for sulfatase activity
LGFSPVLAIVWRCNEDRVYLEYILDCIDKTCNASILGVLAMAMPPPTQQPPQPTVLITHRRLKARYFRENLGNNIGLDMVLIPDGSFLMGAPKDEEGSSDDERPQHPVTIQSFCLGKYPITQAQWWAVADLPKVNRELKPAPSRFKGDNLPVESISWYDAVEFCDRLTQHTGRKYRLPSEAEWEYACRSVTSS